MINLNCGCLVDRRARGNLHYKINGYLMPGLQFTGCNPFGFSVGFTHCNLSHASFSKMKIRSMLFKNMQLHGADFTECDLTGSFLEKCDLARATFDNTTLKKANFITTFNYSIDPENNRVKKAKFSAPGVFALLNKYDIVIEN